MLAICMWLQGLQGLRELLLAICMWLQGLQGLRVGLQGLWVHLAVQVVDHKVQKWAFLNLGVHALDP